MNARRVLTVTAVIALASLAACAASAPPQPVTDDSRIAGKAQVRVAAEGWRKAIGGRDIERILGYYLPDAWLVGMDGSIVKTADGRRDFWQAIASMPIVTDTVDVADQIDVARSGDLAVQYGQFRQIYADGKGNTTSVPQSFMTTWHRQPDGSWKVAANMSTVRREAAARR